MGDSLGILLEPPNSPAVLIHWRALIELLGLMPAQKSVALCSLRFPLASSRGFGSSGEPPAVRPKVAKPEEHHEPRRRGLVGSRPVPLFSLNPVPSPHLVGFSRGAPQSVAGGRREEDSRVRMESPVLIPDAMDSHMHLDRSLRRLRLDPSIGIQEFLTQCPAPAHKQKINLVGGLL